MGRNTWPVSARATSLSAVERPLVLPVTVDSIWASPAATTPALKSTCSREEVGMVAEVWGSGLGMERGWGWWVVVVVVVVVVAFIGGYTAATSSARPHNARNARYARTPPHFGREAEGVIERVKEALAVHHIAHLQEKRERKRERGEKREVA